jgi:hypothetical protein
MRRHLFRRRDRGSTRIRTQRAQGIDRLAAEQPIETNHLRGSIR